MERNLDSLSMGGGGAGPAQTLQRAIETARRGERNLALQLLEEVLLADPDNETALLWKAGLTPDRQEAMWCLRRVLARSPGHARARAGLAWLQQQSVETPPIPEVAPPEVLGPEEEARGPFWKPTVEEEVPALLPTSKWPEREATWPAEQAAIEQPALGVRGEPEEARQDLAEPRVFPRVVDELRSGMLAEAASPEAAPVRRFLGLQGVQWLILVLLLSGLCGLAGIFWVLTSSPRQPPPTLAEAVVETEALTAAGSGTHIPAPAIRGGPSGDLTVLQIRYFAGEGGPALRMLGEIQSQSPQLLADLGVELVLYSATGEAVVSQPGFVARRVLAPGARSPFEVVLQQPPPPWVRYSVRVEARKVGLEALEASPEVVVLEHAAADLGEGRYRIQGEVENRSDFPADQVEVVSTLYGGEGEEILAVGITDGEPSLLGPGERATFTLELDVPGAVMSGYRLFAQGVRSREQPPR
ncbi:MAG: FxLYD domain-containing protein [Anaerolineae bacterium]